MQLPNLQANKAASSTVAPKKQQSIRPQSGGLMKATMTKQLMPKKGDEVSPVTMEKMVKPTTAKPTSAQNFMRTTMTATPQSQSDAIQPSRYAPTQMNVNSDMRVEDRVMGLMSNDNPLMKKAREQANQYSASRGLQSSSIANENALNSMFNAALPIAQQDAETYTTTATVNNQNAQAVGMQDNASLNQLMLNKDNQQFQSGQSAQDRALQKELQESQQQFQSGESQADRELAQQESQADRNLAKELEELKYQNSLGLLDVEGQQKMKELESQQDFTEELEKLRYQNSLGLLDAEGQQRMKEIESQQDFTGELERLKYQNSLGLLDAEGQLRMEELESQQGFTEELEQLKYENSLGLLDAEGEQRLQELEKQQEFQSSEKEEDRSFTKELEELKYQNSLGMLDAEGQQRMEELESQQEFEMEREKYKSASQLEVNMALQDDMQTFNKELEEMRNANQMGLLDAEGEQRMRELEQQNVNAIAQLDRSAEIQTERDELLQQFQEDTMKLEAANRLAEIEKNAKIAMEQQRVQNAFNQKMTYSNAVSNSVNEGISALGNAFMNPEIDPSQYENIQSQIQDMVQQNIDTYGDIYGIGGATNTSEPYRGNNNSAGGNTTIPGGSTGGLMGSAENGRFNTDLPPTAVR